MFFTIIKQNYTRLDKSTLLGTTEKFYHDDELYAAKLELNNYVSSLSTPPLIDGWTKFVNKQGTPIVRKSSDAATKRHSEAEDLLQMFAVLDVQQIQLPTYVAADLDRIPGVASCNRPIDTLPDTSKLNATVEELMRRFEAMEKKLQAPFLSTSAAHLPTGAAATAEPVVPSATDGHVASLPDPSAESAVRNSWAAQAAQLVNTGMQPRKPSLIRVRGKDTSAAVKAVPRYSTCFVTRISPDVTEEDVTEMLEGKGIIGVRCRKIEPKNGRTYRTAAFRVSCNATYESILYDASSWPEGAEIRQWYFNNNNGGQ